MNKIMEGPALGVEKGPSEASSSRLHKEEATSHYLYDLEIYSTGWNRQHEVGHRQSIHPWLWSI
jgi:hypothetical protein